MTCKDSLKGTGLFSLEGSGERLRNSPQTLGRAAGRGGRWARRERPSGDVEQWLMLGWTCCPQEVSSGLKGGFNIKLKNEIPLRTGGAAQGAS